MRALAFTLCAWLVGGGSGGAQEAALADTIADGREVARNLCADCHAIDQNTKSPRPDAPPFNRIEQVYKLPVLEEELIQGIKLGHPDMPQFQLPPRGVDALLAYMHSVQRNKPR